MKKSKKILPIMEDYKKIHYIGHPACHQDHEHIAWSDTFYCDSLSESKSFENSTPAAQGTFHCSIQSLNAAGKIGSVSAGGTLEKQPSFCKNGGIYFLSNVTGEFQLYYQKENDIFQISQLPYGVSDYILSPDEQKILLTGYDSSYSSEFNEPVLFDSHPFKSDADLGFKRKRKEMLWILYPEQIMALEFSKDSNMDYRFSHSSAEKTILLLDKDTNFQNPIWSHDSNYILYRTIENRGISFYKIGLQENSVPKHLLFTDNICTCYSNDSSMEISSDGSYLVMAANPAGSEYAHPGSLYMIPLQNHDGTSISAIDLIHPDWNTTGMETTLYPSPRSMVDCKRQTFCLFPDHRCIYLAPKNGTFQLYQITVTPDGNGHPIQLSKDEDCFHSLTRLNTHSILTIHTDSSSFGKLTKFDIDTGSYTVIDSANKWSDEYLWQAPQSHWIGTLGSADYTHGFFLPPAHLDENKRYPAILYCHGGPTGFYGPSLNLEFQALSAAGFAVLYVNPRGSTGYGLLHSNDDDAYNGNAAADLENFVRYICRLYSWIHPEKIGICGGSYGGYMTTYLATKSLLFRAASCHRPLLNWQMIGYASHSAGCIHSRITYPDFTDYLRSCLDISPVTYGEDIKIPFQIQQSILDANCIKEQVFQLYTVIRKFNPDIPCRLILYPDSGHSLLSKGPLSIAIQHRLDNLSWFLKWLS